MGTPRRFAVKLMEGGYVRIAKTDGGEITPEETQWLSELIRDRLRMDALAGSVPHLKAKAQADTKEESREGVRFEVDPIVLQLEREREYRGYSRAPLSRVVFMGVAGAGNKLGDYVRGAARPQLETLRTWAAVLEHSIMVVPNPLRDQVKQLVADWYAQRAKKEAA